MTKRRLQLLLSSAVLASTAARMAAQEDLQGEPVVEVCAEYSGAGDLLKASVSAHAFMISVTQPSGSEVDLNGKLSGVTFISAQTRFTTACHIAISSLSDRAVLAVRTTSGLSLQFLDLEKRKLGYAEEVPAKYPIQFSFDPVGFLDHSDQLAVSQDHYLPTGEPEVSTRFVDGDGSISADTQGVTGPKYAEISESSFDFVRGRVWFLCPAYSERIDRQPRCTFTSASLNGAAPSVLTIPPPPNDRVVGSGQPNLGFPSTQLVVILAQDRLWLYSFQDGTFRQMNIPETPHHIRWFEFPGESKFSSDGRFAAIPVFMSHAPLFEEGEVPHGMKLLLVDLGTLQILQTIQPKKQERLVDFAIHNNGKDLTVVENWGKDWKTLTVPIILGQ